MKDAAGLINDMQNYDKDNIPDAVVEKIEPFLLDPNFEPGAIAKSSKAVMGMCKWVRAMMSYHKTAKVVGPKREALKAAKAKLAEATDALAVKKADLAAVEAKLLALEETYASTVAEKDRLEAQVS